MSENITAQNAPRDVNALAALQPFTLRKLIEELGGLNDAAKKFAWGNMNPGQRAQEIYNLLVAADAGGGPPPAAAAPTQAAPPPQQSAPVRQPVTNGTPAPMQQQPLPGTGAPQVAGVSPVGAAAAAAAAAPEGRKPRTTKDDAGLGAEVLTGLQKILGGLSADADRFQKLEASLMSVLRDAAADKTGRVDALEGKFAETKAELEGHSVLIGAILSLLLMLAENQLGGPSNALLKRALEDSQELGALIAQLASGK